jgi:serine/threonine-protein kinase
LVAVAIGLIGPAYSDAPERSVVIDKTAPPGSLVGPACAGVLAWRVICVDNGSDLVAGRYELRRVLGSGGMAIVYAARDRRLERDVAVKLIPVEATPVSERERFAREARAAAGLWHPNAVAVFDAGESDGVLYIVMELVDGQTLAKELSEGGRFDVDEAVAVTSSILAALGHAHVAGIVHRDVKPANIMLSSRGEVKLLDFGIARRLDEIGTTITSARQIVGTPTYLAPEQLDGRPTTTASDLYAVGVLLFELLVGEPPFRADGPVATALAHTQAPVPDVRVHRPDVPPALAAAISRAMAKDPDHRFPDAAMMSAAITAGAAGRVLAPASIGQPRATEVMPVLDPPRRRPWWLAGVAGLLVAAAVLWTTGGAVIRYITTGDPPERSALASPTTTPRTAAPTTIAATTAPPTTVPTLAGVIATLQADPTAYGQHTAEIIAELIKIEQGDNPEERAAALLDTVRQWVDSGEQTPATLTLVEQVLAPLAAAGAVDDGQGGGGGGNGGGNGNGNGGGNGNGNGRGRNKD